MTILSVIQDDHPEVVTKNKKATGNTSFFKMKTRLKAWLKYVIFQDGGPEVVTKTKWRENEIETERKPSFFKMALLKTK